MTEPTVTRAGARADHSPSTPNALRIGAVIAILLLIAVIAVFAVRRTSSAATDADARAKDVAKGPPVKIATAEASPPVRNLVLLGEARPYASVTLYAKVSGYLKDVRVDRGDRVAAGALIATIESPETDRAYDGAKAEFENKAQIARRIGQLLAKKFVSAQEAEQADADAAIAKQRLASLAEQRAYEVLRAPFAGTVTARFADPGALMQSAANSQTSALPVVTVSQTDSLRVTVYLDQVDASSVHAGTGATITLDDRPGFSKTARVARVSGELDGKTRKMETELDVRNRDGALVPGGFVRVTLDVPQPSYPQAPAEALVVRKNGTFVGVVGADGFARLHRVEVGLNDGKTVTFVSGVNLGEKLALNLGAGAADSVRVQGAP